MQVFDLLLNDLVALGIHAIICDRRKDAFSGVGLEGVNVLRLVQLINLDVNFKNLCFEISGYPPIVTGRIC